ncbi:MAG: MGMT family protein [Gemmatimonadota bacterium]
MLNDDRPFAQRVTRLVRGIPYGKVASYGDVAMLAGSPRAARGVGAVLSALPEESDVPWWRVVNGTGRISIRNIGGRMQRMLLEQEGIRFTSGERIDLTLYRWRPRTDMES